MGFAKPEPGAILNRAHPAATGLCLALLFNDRTGEYIDYSPLRQPVQRSNATTAIPAFPAQGQGQTGVAANWNTARGTLEEIDILRQGPNKFANSAVICSVLARWRFNDTNNNTVISIGQRIDANNSLLFYVNTALRLAGSAATANGPSASANVWNVGGFTQTATNARRFFINQAFTANATTIGNGAIGATNPFTVGNNYGNATSDGTFAANGMIDYVFAWYVALSDATVMGLNMDPFGGLFVLPKRKIWNVPAAVITSSITNQAYMHYARMRARSAA